jgi:lipoate-protein ligase A
VTFRLLVTEPLDGATNMAIDEALLASRLAGSGPPTVRLYAWAPPAVSLGYGQALDGAVDTAACARLGIGLVRRPTGGSAILHEGPAAELTYSVVARAADLGGGEDLLETYRLLGTALARGLARLGVAVSLVDRVRATAASPAFCFGRAGAYELAVGGRKLCGSAQRRQGGAFLQHGTLLLGADPERLRAVFPAVADPLATVTTLAALLGRAPRFADVAAAIAEGFREVLGPLAPGGLSAAEAGAAERLAAEKYASPAWTQDGGLAPAHA